MDTQSVTRHHLEVPGGRVYYEVRGSGPLLLVVGQPMTERALRTAGRPARPRTTRSSPTTPTAWDRAPWTTRRRT